MTSHNVIDVGEVLTGNGITGEYRLALQLPRLDDGVEVIIAHRAVTCITQTDRVGQLILNRIVSSGDRYIRSITDTMHRRER